MTVDFAFKKSPAYRVAALRWKGAWSDARIHAQFLRVAAWAKAHGLRTGKWIFLEPAERTWEVAVQVRGPARSGNGIRVRTMPGSRVASVTFDPGVVSPAVVYHGVHDWLRARRKDRTIARVGAYREVYGGDPWKDRRALARTEIQVLVRP
jgi:effector-binding domain-containing protein